MRETSEVRRQRILAVIASRGTVRVSDLAEELDVSIVTVRRDVEELARLGKLRRGHGVVRSLTPVEQPAPRQAVNGAVALVVPERHTYLYETMNGARKVLEEAGMRVVLHIAPQVRGPSGRSSNGRSPSRSRGCSSRRGGARRRRKPRTAGWPTPVCRPCSWNGGRAGGCGR